VNHREGRKLRVVSVIFLAAVVCIGSCTRPPAPRQTADVVYTGGDIITVNDSQPTAEALAVKDGKILAVGAKADVLKHKGAATKK